MLGIARRQSEYGPENHYPARRAAPPAHSEGRGSSLLFPAKIYCGQSLLDARRDSVIVDYSYNDDINGYRKSPDLLAGRGGLRIRDEIRMVRPGLYLGRAYANRAFLLNFTLFNAAGGRTRRPGLCTRRGRLGRLLARGAAAHDRGAMITLPPPTRLKLAVHSAFRKIQRALRRIDPFFRLRSIRFS